MIRNRRRQAPVLATLLLCAGWTMLTSCGHGLPNRALVGAAEDRPLTRVGAPGTEVKPVVRAPVANSPLYQTTVVLNYIKVNGKPDYADWPQGAPPPALASLMPEPGPRLAMSLHPNGLRFVYRSHAEDAKSDKKKDKKGGDGDVTGVVDALQAAMASWEGAIDGDLFREADIEVDPADWARDDPGSFVDGINTLAWARFEGVGKNAIAATFLWANEDGLIVEVDILLNTRYSWRVNRSIVGDGEPGGEDRKGQGGEYDVQAALTHELGHVLGLADVDGDLYAKDLLASTMYPYMWARELKKQTMTAQDAEAASGAILW